MCTQTDNAMAALSAATIAAAPTNNCMCCYQLEPCRVKSSSHAKSAKPTTPKPACSNLWHIFAILTTVLVLFDHCLLRTCAAPQSCVLCDINDLKASGKQPSSSSYEEYLFEHQVTRQDAINALKMLNESFYDGPSPEQSCKSVSCTKPVMKYCLSPQFVNDHCWCELGHTDEGLPFIPHICYVGEKNYSPSVGSCFFYEEVKECCCAPALAKQWRHISRASSNANVSTFLLTLSLLMLTGCRRSRF